MARILVIDDDAHIRVLIADLLGLHGHEIDVADDGVEAINHLKKNNYDLMIIDRNMPNLSGIDAVAIIRTNRKFKDLKILMVTADQFPNDIVKAFELDIDGYMVKPFDVESLLVKVEKILKKQRSGD
ncbi:MAG: response regulator [Elusimicrobiota bacterium]